MSQPPAAFPTTVQQQPPPSTLPPTAAGYPLQHQQQQQQQQQQAAFFGHPTSNNTTTSNVAPYSQPHPQSRPLQPAHHHPQHPQQHQQQQQQQQPYFPQDPDSTMQWNGAMMMAAGGIPQAANYNSSLPHSHYPPQSYPPSSLSASSGQNSASPSHSGLPAGTAAFGGPQQAMTAATTAAAPQSTQPHPAQTSSQSQMQVPAPQGNTNTPSAPQTAPAPPSAREKARVTVLLDINSALLQEVVQLQAAGKAGVTSNQPMSQQASPTQENNTGSPSSNADNTAETPKSTQSATTGKPALEYIDCMRRLQANLAYLATVADRAKKTGSPTPPAPAIMTPPPHLPSINELYNKLNELFPGAPKGVAPLTPQQPRGAQNQNKPQTPQAGDNSAGSTPNNEAGG